MSGPLITQFDERIAWQYGYVLLDLLIEKDRLPDELKWALWTENSGDVLPWFLRAQRRIMDKVPAAYQQQFIAGVYERYFDFVVCPSTETALPSRGDDANTPAPASPHLHLLPEDVAHVATLEERNRASETGRNATEPYRALTDQEQKALAAYEKKCALIRDKVRAVVKGTKLGALIYGEGGIGKTFQVESAFRELQIKPIRTNSQISPRGLVDLIRKNATRVHFLEDVETLFEKKSAFGFLRSALWGPKDEQGEMHRMATWVLHDKEIRIPFTGKIIVTANCPLDDLPELRALATRVVPYHFQASKEELLAMMKKLCNGGYGPYKGVTLTPAECFEVLDFYLKHVPAKRHHDLRILEQGFWDRIDAIKGVLKETTWQEQFLAEIRKGKINP